MITEMFFDFEYGSKEFKRMYNHIAIKSSLATTKRKRNTAMEFYARLAKKYCVKVSKKTRVSIKWLMKDCNINYKEAKQLVLKTLLK